MKNLIEGRRAALKAQLVCADELDSLLFDDPRYEQWRAETGRLLDQIFGQLESEPHPCTKAFLNYRIPETFSASRGEMQNFYQNIIRYQTDLLKAYLEDLQESGGVK